MTAAAVKMPRQRQRKRFYIDHESQSKFALNKVKASLAKTLPADWLGHVDALAAGINALPVWMQTDEFAGRLRAFAKEHGDALRWNLSDGQICEKAEAFASHFDAQVSQCDALRHAGLATGPLDYLVAMCKALDVEPPRHITAEGAVRRGQDVKWWRRVLRRKVARAVELGYIKLGMVSGARGSSAYCSASAAKRRAEQNARNAAMMDAVCVKNEMGQVWRLSSVAKLGVSNPMNRHGELMTRMRGAEDYAEQAGHIPLGVTLTCPSKYHAMRSVGKGRAIKNEKYGGYSPRDAQAWLCQTWARVRAALARAGVKLYGMRVAEPHADATPHWHGVFFVENERQAADFYDIVEKYWLAEDGDEPGARLHRFEVKRLHGKGAAAKYISKYISKNIAGTIDLPYHSDKVDGVETVIEQDACDSDAGPVRPYGGPERVQAWAATWGIRQFQSVGQPPVTWWRALRAVDSQQLDYMMAETGERYALQAWHGVHRHGEGREGQASWHQFMRALGGPCLPRKAYPVSIARQPVEQGKTNSYGEPLKCGRMAGLRLRSGFWLVSKHVAWYPAAKAEKETEAEEMGRLAQPWSGFNNCTPRLAGKNRDFVFRAALARRKEREAHEKAERSQQYLDWLAEKMTEIDANRAIAGGSYAV